MRILIFHGDYGNFGDAGMLESVVRNLYRNLPGAELFVVDRKESRADVWNLSYVHRQFLPWLKLPWGNALSGVPYFWRHDELWRAVASKGFSLGVGSIFAAEKVRISAPSTGEDTLEEFCRRFDSLHIVGGGYLTDTFPAPLMQLAFLTQAFLEQKKPVVLTGQQVGPFKSQIFERLVRKILRGARFVGLREPISSYEHCRKFRLKPECFAVMGDDSFGLASAPEADVSACLAAYGLQPRKFVAFNLRIGSYAASESDLQFIANLADCVSRLLRLPVAIMPIAFNEGDSDDRFGERMLKLMRHSEARRIHSDHLTPALIRGLLGKAFGAAGVSYHFCTFALSQGTPAVSLYSGNYYSQKGQGLCAFWNNSRLAIPLAGAQVEGVAESIAELFQDLSWRTKLGERARSAISNWQTIFDEQVRCHSGDPLKRSASSKGASSNSENKTRAMGDELALQDSFNWKREGDADSSDGKL